MHVPVLAVNDSSVPYFETQTLIYTLPQSNITQTGRHLWFDWVYRVTTKFSG